jgi:hypothetical protein
MDSLSGFFFQMFCYAFDWLPYGECVLDRWAVKHDLQGDKADRHLRWRQGKHQPVIAKWIRRNSETSRRNKRSASGFLLHVFSEPKVRSSSQPLR